MQKRKRQKVYYFFKKGNVNYELKKMFHLHFSASTSQSVILWQQLHSCEKILKTYPIYIQI